MADEPNKIEDKASEKKERMDALKKKVNKTDKISREDYIKQLATREKLERDYKEDHLYVTFNSSPETRRTILARKPNQKEFINILALSIEAGKYEGKFDGKSGEKMTEIYGNLNKMAASLSIDKKLDEKFWSNCVSFSTLQSFITELIVESQKGFSVPEEDVKSFR